VVTEVSDICRRRKCCRHWLIDCSIEEQNRALVVEFVLKTPQTSAVHNRSCDGAQVSNTRCTGNWGRSADDGLY